MKAGEVIYPELRDGAWMAEQIEAGKTQAEIADTLGCSRAAVSVAVADLGLVQYRRHYPVHPLLSDRAWMESQIGSDYNEIALAAGVSRASVRNWIRRHHLSAQYRQGIIDRNAARAAQRTAERLAAKTPPKYPLLRDVEALTSAVNERGVSQVATEIGCHISSVMRALERAGVDYPRRSVGRPRKDGQPNVTATGPHFVYRLFDAADVSLYVGSTRNLGVRIGQHRRRPWGHDISRFEVSIHEARLEALEVKAAERQRLQPIHCVERDPEKRLPPGGLIQLILAGLRIKPMTQTEVERWLLSTGYVGSTQSAGNILSRLCGSGDVSIVEERPSASGRWASTRVYGIAA